ncbi:MAG TPA: hypothetical protein VGN90_01200 [Pyrinomonadaceae bacterium]|jgi:uncharacterized membrane protein|nr:hypothetical protein [Pyrinomonadaceae bacterium]
MSFPFNEIEFKRNAVQPMECVKAGFELIKSQYWLFVGITVVGILIGSVVPLGILMGPMMCGIYLALFQTRRGNPIEFNLLFKGFDYFGDAVIAMLLHMIPIIIVIVPTYILFYAGMFGMMAASGNSEPNPAALMGFFGFMLVVWFVIMILLIVLSVVFTFAYPLIVDRRLSGLNAVKLSIRAGLANFWRLLGMLLVTGLLTFVGVLFCYVGAFLVMPISFAAIAIAYEQVFGLGELAPNLPPPPPTFT